jgi:hypothetical protein
MLTQLVFHKKSIFILEKVSVGFRNCYRYAVFRLAEGMVIDPAPVLRQAQDDTLFYVGRLR